MHYLRLGACFSQSLMHPFINGTDSSGKKYFTESATHTVIIKNKKI